MALYKLYYYYYYYYYYLDKKENNCTSHKYIPFAISVPKIIKVGGNSTKFWQKQFCTVFLRHGV